MSSTEPFILINAFEVPEGSDAEFVAAWQAAREFQATVTSDAFRAAAAGLASYRSDPGLYRVVGG